ncbi:hypothetical protein ASPSYDRAFT_143534 [Aspergillus sydowii CBS 593.65]|uniref:C2H2-type domain-containing protein n=1 Tax=Aspergillus sydowii CBS 593.65 TaxID=1036612 RepID=A0A1L9TTW4_9EURO|nr:uncharacterized protein ASPSYDRAFT_143534 [Aspergillus sydowii CBS 593.65]OJJ62815.1 hypothetical protein ASPSYDRAFT_143534 [Aspergillus sydowii CBS 593.65]
MFMHPSVRKGAITEPTEPTSAPFINYPDSVFIQDDQFLPEYSQDLAFQYLSQEQPHLQPPFHHYRQDLTCVSPPNSVPSSPTSSPASSISQFPATTAASANYAAVFDGSSSLEAPSMTPASSYNPEIHIQHSGSPQPQSYLPQYHQQQFVFGNPQMLAQQYINNHGWENNAQLSNPAHAHAIPRMAHQYTASQQQTPSSSSGRSPGNSFNGNNYSSTSTKPLPTPVHTPVQQSFLTPQFQKNDLSQDGNYSFMAEQQQNQPQHQHQSSDHSHAASVSTVSHNSPVTPQNHYEEVDDSSKAAGNGETQFSADDRWLDDYLHFDLPPDYNAASGLIPKLNRTMTDIYQDELLNPAAVTTPQAANQSSSQQHALLAPSYPNMIANRLQAANSARTQSPVGSIHRERSPFRQNSPLAAEYENDAFQQQQAVTSVPTSQNGMAMQHQPQTEQPKTISPKDAVLNDFNEGDEQGLHMPYQPDFNLGDTLGLRQDNTFQAPSFPSMDSFPAQFNQAPNQQFSFNHPEQGRRQSLQQQQNFLHQTPDFPASLPRFESTGSDVYSNDMASPSMSRTVQRPQNTSAEGGTYTCTYHGCTHRFETPSRLQKHKREAHRQTTPGGHMVPRGDVSSRNSQAGPHKCERTNPSTGKPCNSVFSRPYDLTRHEDTIHNARKQKVRCHLCTEEKTFSRNDALTRHMRVVHPEVDWPGKQKRRGRE